MPLHIGGMTTERYSRSAMLLHAAIALALAFQLALGWRLEHIPKGPGLFTAYQLHKSVGITILLLSLVRLAIRYWKPRPAMSPDKGWAQMLSKFVHFGLYAVMIGGPISGWVIVSTAKLKVPTLLFGIVPWPHLPVGMGLHERAEFAHGMLATLGLFLFALHFVGALRHQFLLKEPMLGRMIPGGAQKPLLASVLAFAAMFAANSLGWQLPLVGDHAPAIESGKSAAPVVAGEPLIEDDRDLKALAAEADAKKKEADALNAKTEADAAKLKAEEAEKAKLAGEKPGDEAKAAPEQLANWTISPGGRLGFIASWGSVPVNGSFGSWSGKVRFSPDVLDKTDIRIAVDLGSVNTKDSQRDSQLKGADFFNIGAHPQAVFTANSARDLGNGRYSALGTLSLHGVSRPVTVNFTLKINGDRATVSGTARLDRTSFGVGSGEYAGTDQIGGNVAVNFGFTATR